MSEQPRRDAAHANRAELEQLDEFVCPECAAGKHDNCDGSAWDDVLDDVTDCECSICRGTMRR